MGQWTAGGIAREGDPAYVERCLALTSIEIQLTIMEPINGQNGGFMAQDRRVSVIGDEKNPGQGLPALVEACGLKNAKDPLFGAQSKGWGLAAQPDQQDLAVETTSATCLNDWCGTTDPRFPFIKPDMGHFSTTLQRKGPLLVDMMGTPDPKDDVTYLPRVDFELRSNEGRDVAVRFMTALMAGRDADAEKQLYKGPLQGMTSQDIQSARAWLTANVQGFGGVSAIEQRLGTTGDRPQDKWAIRLRLQMSEGRFLDVAVWVWAQPSGEPGVGGIRTYG